MQQTYYTIPSMRPKDIAEFLSENGFNILVTDITNPNPAYICRLYEGILNVFLEKKIPEADESVSMILIYFHMKTFVEKIKAALFTMHDIISPEAGKTVKILSAVVNYALFKENKRHVLNRIVRRREEIEGTIEETKKNIFRNREILLQKRKEKKESAAKKNFLLEHISQKEQEIVNYHRVQQSLTKEIEKAGNDQKQISAAISHEKTEILALQQEITRLTAKIVKNPEQLKELLIAMKNQMQDENEILREYEVRFRLLQENLSRFNRVTEEIKNFTAVVSLLGKYSEDCANKEISLEKLKNENSILETKNKSKFSRKILLEKKIEYIVEKMSRLTEEDAARIEGLKTEFAALRERHSQVLAGRENSDRLIQKNHGEAKELEKEIIRLESEHQSRVSGVYNELLQEKSFLEGYGEDLQKIFKGEYFA
ncbi:kinetochore protein Nuf2 [Nematocida major]|uniref:kinetochore protein Nuf2 n=1 Tax=Nematocida major TaxID=1912982 RepID=UPI00200762FE|nr:kinetochore protein Nuf2 [Nematocida major]KAH9385825.1 kinetochore protein Nuf2 [Nematocida major]